MATLAHRPARRTNSVGAPLRNIPTQNARRISCGEKPTNPAALAIRRKIARSPSRVRAAPGSRPPTEQKRVAQSGSAQRCNERECQYDALEHLTLLGRVSGVHK